MNPTATIPCLLLFLSPAGATLQEGAALELVDLSESGAALELRFEGAGRAGSAMNPVVVRRGPAADRDVLDLEVRGAAAGEPVHFRVPDPSAGAAPASSHGEFLWAPVEGLRRSGEELRFEVTPRRSRFLVRLRPPRPPGSDAPYYPWGRFGEYVASLAGEPLARVTRIGSSVQGRPLYRILVDDETLPSPKKTILMVVRQHGDEDASSYVLEGLLDLMLERAPGGAPERIYASAARARHLRRYRWIIYPFSNPDGAAANQRYNANGVDLNRDWDRNGCHPGQQPETYTIQCDLEALDVLYDVDIGGDHHGWTYGYHGGFRYALASTPSSVTRPEYDEARKDTTVVTRHDPGQYGWIENGGTVGMARVEMFLLANFLIHTPEYDSSISSAAEFRAKGRAWGEAMADTLQAPRFSDANGGPLLSARLGDGVHVTVDDDDENVSPEPVDSVQVTVSDPTSGDVEIVTLAELARGGLFRNAAPLPLAPGVAVPGNGVLETAPGARLTARYVDDDYPRDESTARLRVR